MNDPKVFKILINYKRYGFGLKLERSKINVRVRVNSNTAWIRTQRVPSSFSLFKILQGISTNFQSIVVIYILNTQALPV